MAWLFAVFFFGFSSAFAATADEVAEKVTALLNNPCEKNFSAPHGLIEVVYLRGSPIDTGNAPQAGQKLLEITQKVAHQRGYDLRAEAVHHTSWKSICERLNSSQAKHIYLVGHSYGAAGAVKIAHCLKENYKNVSLLSTISSYDLWTGVDVTRIPDNVISHSNFYTTDPSMPGYDNHRADDPDHTTVENILAEQTSSFPHLDVAENVVGLVSLQILADFENQLSCVKIPGAFNANEADENLAQFWKLDHEFTVPHIDLETSSQELRSLLKIRGLPIQVEFDSTFLALEGDPIAKARALGERLFLWVEYLNKNRTEQILLSNPKDRRGIPIENPNRYGPHTIAKETDEILMELPEEMREVLVAGKDFTAQLEMPVEAFISFGRRIDRNYQAASRWRLLLPYKSQYIKQIRNDIRGYYFLSRGQWDANSLKQKWGEVAPEVQAQLREALAGLCVNSGQSVANCQTRANGIQKGSEAAIFFQNYIRFGQKAYKTFFDIENPRGDISWSRRNPSQAVIPFKLPPDASVQNFVKGNIEDEYRFGDWGLKINFVDRSFGLPYIIFIPGQNAHVEFLGGNRIVMDGNKSLEEYEEQWVIRHEFGHVLGLPDCYHEFFDQEKNEFVNYQIDITDLMCSRAGNMNARIYESLKAQYLR